MKKLLSLLLTVSAACASTGVTNFGGDDLLVQVSIRGGFVPIEFHLRALPLASVSNSGTWYGQGPQIEIYPPAAIPSIVTRSLTTSALDQIRNRAEEAGLNSESRHLELAGIADAGDTIFEYVDTSGEAHKISVYALGDESAMAPRNGISAADAATRSDLAKFRDDLGDLDAWISSDELGNEETYSADAWRVYFSRADANGSFQDPAIAADEREWPLASPEELAGEPGTSGYSCAIVTGADLQTLEDAFISANTQTGWTHADTTYLVVIRPLLPHESGCPSDF